MNMFCGYSGCSFSLWAPVNTNLMDFICKWSTLQVGKYSYYLALHRGYHVPTKVEITYHGKGFPNAGPMANPKWKVDKGIWPTELEQDCGLCFPCRTVTCTHCWFEGSNLSGLKTSGSAKCSGIRHIAPVDI